VAEILFEEGVALLQPEAGLVLPLVDMVVFDIDGVLLDVSRSIRTVNCLSVPAYLRTLPGWTAPDDLLTSEEIELFKEAGGFNDDWDLTRAAVLLYLLKSVRYGSADAVALHPRTPTIAEYTSELSARGGWLKAAEELVFSGLTASDAAIVQSQYDPDRIIRLFQELWAGDLCPRIYGFVPAYFRGEGFIRLDRPLLDLSLLPAGRQIGFLTGRSLAEAQVALERVGIAEQMPLPGPQGMTKDDGSNKPQPWGMRDLLVRMNSRVALYIGDTVDDMRTVLAFRHLPEARDITVLSAQVLTGTTAPEIAPTLFAPADLLATDVNAVLRYLGRHLPQRIGDSL